MSRARDLSKLGNPNVIVADTERVGFGTQVPENVANAASSLISAGIVTATAYYGDGSNLEGVASAGLGTAVDDTKDSIGQNIYFTNAELSINENTTVNAPDTSSIAYTQYQQVTVESGSELIIADGDSFIPDVLGIGTALQASTAGAGNGLFGTVYADNIENAAGRGGPNFPLGITVAGVSTLGGNVSIGGTLTYEDVTNVDSIGIVTARSGIKVIAGGIDVTGNSNIVGDFAVGSHSPTARLDVRRGDADGKIAELHQVTGYGLDIGSSEADAYISSGYLQNFILKSNPGAGQVERLRISKDGAIGLSGANYGTSGQVMTSQGNSAAPQWADAGGGAWEFVSSTSLGADYGASTFNITGFTTSYSQYKIVLNDVGFVGAAAKKLYAKFYIDGSLYGGASQATYSWSADRIEWHANSSVGGQYGKYEMQMSVGTSNAHWGGIINMPMQQNAATSTMSPYCWSELQTDDYYTREGCKVGSANNTTTTGLQLYNGTDSVNFGNYGRISVYRLKLS